MTQQDIINDNIIKQYEIRVQQDSERIHSLNGELAKIRLERDHAANACARQSELLELADTVIRSLKNVDTINKMQIIISNYLNDPMK